jgi:hypothetical protein
LALALVPVAEAELQETPTAEAGTVVHPVKVAEFAYTLKVHVLPLAPPLMLHPTVALELPATALPGLFAVNWRVAGVAVSPLTPVANGIGESAGLKDWMTGVGRRGLSVVF